MFPLTSVAIVHPSFAASRPAHSHLTWLWLLTYKCFFYCVCVISENLPSWFIVHSKRMRKWGDVVLNAESSGRSSGPPQSDVTSLWVTVTPLGSHCFAVFTWKGIPFPPGFLRASPSRLHLIDFLSCNWLISGSANCARTKESWFWPANCGLQVIQC